MKKGECAEVLIEKVKYPNKGVGSIEGLESVVIKNAAPGQKVLCRITKIRNGRGQGQLLEVVEKAPGELDPVCPHFGKCGGCVWLTMPYEEQLRMKEEQVYEVLSPAVGEEAEKGWFLGIKGSPVISGYRNKMEYTFGDDCPGGPLTLGLHKRGSFYDILTVEGCALVHPDFSRLLRATLDFFSDKGVGYYHRVRHEGYLRYLIIRRGAHTGEILVDIVTSSQCDREDVLLEGWCSAVRALESDSLLEGKIVGILHTRDDAPSDAVRDEGTRILYGQGFFYEELLGLRFLVSPFSFFQTNSAGAQVLYETARQFALEAAAELAGSSKDKKLPVIFDLYSGTGTIAQMMSPAASKVIGVEIVPEAVRAAKENAKLNGITNCEFYAGDVLKVVPQLSDSPDIIILDPPRDGCHPKAIGDILGFNAPVIIYISCKVTSLARDMETIRRSGYRLVKAVAIDQFPLTAHVEAVVQLSKGNI